MSEATKTNIAVYKTSEYDVFKKLLGNRDVTEERVSAIVDSIKKIGLMCSPILVNEKMEIIDGQGRYEACKRLSLPVYYIAQANAGIEECIAMNIKMRNWIIDDYVKSYADRGFEAYKELILLHSKYPYLGYNDIAKIMCATADNGGVRKRIVNGTYEIKNYSKGIGCLSFIDEMHEKIESISCKKSTVYSVLMGLYYFDLIDVDRMIEQFNKYSSSTYIGDVDSCLNYLQEVYNYNKKSRFRFKDNYNNMMDMKKGINRKEG